MGVVNVVLIVLGVGLAALGYRRARVPWRRYQALRDQDANVARYEAWRGGVRSDDRSGASVAMAMYRREAQIGGAIVIAGFILVVAGFFIS